MNVRVCRVPAVSALLVTLLMTVSVTPGCVSGPSVGAEAPRFTAVDADGREVRSEAYLGRIVLLDFWATWCPPCRAASPHIQALHERFANDPRIAILAVHASEAGEPEAYMLEHGYTFRMIPDGTGITEAFNIRGLPQYVLLRRDGKVAWRHVGFRAGDEEIIVRAIEDHLPD